MKKTMLFTTLMLVILAFGVAHANAAIVTPSISGTIGDGPLGAGEWANDSDPAVIGNQPYPYYLEVFDPDESDNINQNMDIKHGVLLQHIDIGPYSNGNLNDDGIYLLLEVYGPPPSLKDPDGLISSLPNITLEGDFEGDGIVDVVIRHFNQTPLDAVENLAQDKVTICFTGGNPMNCSPGFGAGPFSDLPTVTGYGGSGHRGAFARSLVPAATSVIEYFIPSGFGTPIAIFPYSFIGQLTYDNGDVVGSGSGVGSADDIVIGGPIIIPEPMTMMMLGGALLSLLGFGIRFKK
ncbi:MAG: hypothetical protein NC930_03175 [Candidatus Omnitrophica bacterium]|nr:hypothetical protein [Candidatus Omnitrophota bacterium]